jgi:hypothetical protein
MVNPPPSAQGGHNQPAEEALRGQLERMLSSSVFIAAPSLSQFLQFVVEETLAGKSSLIKAYTIAVRAWGRERDFDPQSDPIVRIQAGRLRRALKDYYASEGAGDPVRIEIPKGTYVPKFHVQDASRDWKQKPGIKPDEMTPEGPSLAVLPFFNQSEDETQVQFVDGFGEELSVSLARFQDLSVSYRLFLMSSVPGFNQGRARDWSGAGGRVRGNWRHSSHARTPSHLGFFERNSNRCAGVGPAV